MFCPKCGAQLTEGAAFCSSCGSKLDIAVQGTVQTPPPVEPQQSFNQTPPPVEPQQSFNQTPPTFEPQQSFNQTPPTWNSQGFGQPQGGYGQPAMDQYGTMAPARKSKTVPILIAVIAAAVIATVVLLFIFVFNKGGGDIVGKYHAAAMEISGMTIDISNLPGMTPGSMYFDIQDGGKGVASVNGEEHSFTWTLNGSSLDIISDDGKSFEDALTTSGGKMEFRNGRIYVTYEQGGISGSMILAKDGDDLSDIEMSSLSDFIAKMGSEINP